MTPYGYACPNCGPFDSPTAADSLPCPRCHGQAKRRYQVAINRSSLRPDTGRWDPQVGAYVRNEREFRDLVSMGREAESAQLGMTVHHELVDSRDTEALCELHGTDRSARDAVVEDSRFVRAQKMAT